MRRESSWPAECGRQVSISIFVIVALTPYASKRLTITLLTGCDDDNDDSDSNSESDESESKDGERESEDGESESEGNTYVLAFSQSYTLKRQHTRYNKNEKWMMCLGLLLPRVAPTKNPSVYSLQFQNGGDAHFLKGHGMLQQRPSRLIETPPLSSVKITTNSATKWFPSGSRSVSTEGGNFRFYHRCDLRTGKTVYSLGRGKSKEEKVEDVPKVVLNIQATAAKRVVVRCCAPQQSGFFRMILGSSEEVSYECGDCMVLTSLCGSIVVSKPPDTFRMEEEEEAKEKFHCEIQVMAVDD